MKKDNVPSVGWGSAYVVSHDMPRHLEGRFLTLLETLGLTERQEAAVKGFAKQIVWNEFNYAIYISDERHTAIRLEYEKQKGQATVAGTPMSAI